MPALGVLVMRLSLRRLRRRVGSESGFGLIELMISLTILVVGIGGTMSVMAGSLVTLQHAAKEGTAITLADRQLEAYRSLPYTCISSTFTAPSGCLTFSGFPNPYSSSQTTTSSESPDHRTYVVTTSITSITSGLQVTVQVKASGTTQVLGEESSNFSTTGQSSNG
jgi:prepilin-type N-terminal cleavage/methylation domain-containing protein